MICWANNITVFQKDVNTLEGVFYGYEISNGFSCNINMLWLEQPLFITLVFISSMLQYRNDNGYIALSRQFIIHSNRIRQNAHD